MGGGWRVESKWKKRRMVLCAALTGQPEGGRMVERVRASSGVKTNTRELTRKWRL